jgi:hypothetical protein
MVFGSCLMLNPLDFGVFQGFARFKQVPVYRRLEE